MSEYWPMPILHLRGIIYRRPPPLPVPIHRYDALPVGRVLHIIFFLLHTFGVNEPSGPTYTPSYLSHPFPSLFLLHP